MFYKDKRAFFKNDMELIHISQEIQFNRVVNMKTSLLNNLQLHKKNFES